MAQTHALKIFRETVLPSPQNLLPYSVYLVAPEGQEDYVELFVTNSSISSTAPYARRVVNQADVTTLINAKIQETRELIIVADIAARDLLTSTLIQLVFVVDATADATVNSGGATYLYNPDDDVYIKISETESLDVVVNFDDIVGGPNSTAAEIDNAVNRHPVPIPAPSEAGYVLSTEGWTLPVDGVAQETFETISKNLKARPGQLSYENGKIVLITYGSGVVLKTVAYTGDLLTSVTLTGSAVPSAPLVKELIYSDGRLVNYQYTAGV